MYDMDLRPLVLFLGLWIAFFAVAAVFSWAAAAWTGAGLVAATIIRHAGRR